MEGAPLCWRYFVVTHVIALDSFILLAKLLKQRPTLLVSRRSGQSGKLPRQSARQRRKVRPVVILGSMLSHDLDASPAKAAEIEAKKAAQAGKRP